MHSHDPCSSKQKATWESVKTCKFQTEWGKEKKLMKYLFRGDLGSYLAFKECLVPRYFRTSAVNIWGAPLK